MTRQRSFGNHVRWTQPEMDILHRHYPISPLAELRSMLPGRSPATIQGKANALGLVRSVKQKRTPAEIREAKRAHMASRRAENPDGVREYQRAHHHKNREHTTAKMRDYARRRFFWTKACKLRGADAATHKALARLWKAQRGLCALTGRRLDRTAEVDHRLPKARGGSDVIANLQWVTREANRAKRDLTDAEFFALCQDAMRWIGRRIDMVERIAAADPAPMTLFTAE